MILSCPFPFPSVCVLYKRYTGEGEEKGEKAKKVEKR